MCIAKTNVLKFSLATTVAILVLQFLFCAGAFAKPVITDLGTLGGSNPSFVQAINEKGQVIGCSYLADNKTQHGFIWENGKMTDLGTLGGSIFDVTAINENGQVIGRSFLADSSCHGFIWENGKMTDLGTLGGNSSDALAINENGQVIGQSYVAGNKEGHAFIWENGKMTDLGTFGGNSWALAINENGQVIGGSYFADYTKQHGFIWQNGKMTDLGTLGGSNSNVTAINDKGQVIGHSSLAGDKASNGFIWQNGIMTGLGTLGGNSSDALAINEKGQVIGYSYLADGSQHGFIWENGHMIDLGTLGGSYSEALAINEKGEVIGQSYLAGNKTLHGFIWQNGHMTDLGSIGKSSSRAWAINENGQVCVDYYVYDDYIFDDRHASFIWEDIAPVITLASHDTNPINKDITVTATVDDGTLNQTSYTFTQNGSFTFTAIDAVGNTSSKTVTITNIDKTPPVITLKGNPVEYVTCGGIYTDAGAQAIDDVDGDISSLISASGSVNTYTPAIYSVTYSVYDKAGNAAIPASRTVTVTPVNFISPTSALFDLSSPDDIKITFTGGSKLLTVKNGPSDLTSWDYSISGNTVTIKKSYLSYFFTKFNSPGKRLYLALYFDTGNNTVLTVTRVLPTNTLNAANTVFDLSNPQDITVAVTGNTVTTVKNGPSDLTNWDYSVSGNTVTIKKSYLTYFFTKFTSPSQKLNLTFQFNYGSNSVLTITRK